MLSSARVYSGLRQELQKFRNRTEAPARFSSRERNQLEAFVIQVLEAGEDDLPVSWTGKRSGHNAVVDPIAMPGEISTNCRRAAITVIDSNDQALNGQYQFCKNDQGRWQYQSD